MLGVEGFYPIQQLVSCPQTGVVMYIHDGVLYVTVDKPRGAQCVTYDPQHYFVCGPASRDIIYVCLSIMSAQQQLTAASLCGSDRRTTLGHI